MRRLRLLPLFSFATLAALLAVPLASVEAGPPKFESAPYRDKEHKFSLKIFKDYKPVPLQPGQTDTVCRFRDTKSKGQQRGTWDTTIEVVRVVIDGSSEPVVTGGPADPPRRGGGGGRGVPERARDAWGATIGRLAARLPPNIRQGLDRKKFKKVKSKDKPKIEGKLYTFELALGGRGRSLFITLATYEKNKVEYGILMMCGKPLRKSFERAFVTVAKSFKFKDKRAKDVEVLDELDGVNITVEKRRAIETGMVSGWDVVVSPKKNYIIIYNTKRGTNHKLAKEIARRIELIREQIYEVQFPPARPIKAVSIVRVCMDAKEYRAYGGPGGSAGYWNPGDEELVFYDASASKRPDDNTLSVLYHEAFHQYIHYSVGRVAPHSWFNEGHGDYYAGAKLKGKKFKIYPFRWRVGRIKNAIVQGSRPFTEVTDDDGNVRKKWQPRGYTPLEELVRFSQREYYSYPGVCYAQGWSLIYFLREVVPKNKKWNAKWGHILDTYFDTLKAEVNKARQPPPGAEGPAPPPKPDGGEPKPTPPDQPKDGPTAPEQPEEPPATPDQPKDEPPTPDQPKDEPPAPEPPSDVPPPPEQPKNEPPAPEPPSDEPPAPEPPQPEPSAPEPPSDEPPAPEPPQPEPSAPEPPSDEPPAPEPPQPEPSAPDQPSPEPATPGQPTPPVEPGDDGADPEPEGDGGEGDGGEDEGKPPPPEQQEAPRTIFEGLGGAAALKKAVEEAFKGVDWEELEKAWLKSTKRVK